MNFEADRQIRCVMAQDNGGSAYVLTANFSDKDGSMVCSYAPNGHGGEGGMEFIGANEELIGVYGIKDKNDYLDAYGFIVKVRQ